MDLGHAAKILVVEIEGEVRQNAAIEDSKSKSRRSILDGREISASRPKVKKGKRFGFETKFF
ncbi:hypothetical protein [Mycoplana dimorpha]|uniref:hypothetical protein n=1 Tax=Mycoplana dimorpha TaxID=28320 RepID=UPI0011B234C8|nr:hypothetical protein [Mycoplana dimorpha]